LNVYEENGNDSVQTITISSQSGIWYWTPNMSDEAPCDGYSAIL
jgi:hypothetical protein